ncbi:MAG: aminotransferase class I/II-fold pyridoxal phosphate-dependent enzyme, partial [Candidatus Eiseniibacteriota bacterium]
MTIRFPYARQSITRDDVAAVAAAVEGPLLTQGPVLEAFEAALADSLGARHAVVCNSGTAALHLAYLALDLGPERGLVTTPITFLATANAARMCGAPVAFADVDPATGNMAVEAAR